MSVVVQARIWRRGVDGVFGGLPHRAWMSALLFDTLRLSRTLREKGHFTPERADTLAKP
jgi:hypothetical protein